MFSRLKTVVKKKKSKNEPELISNLMYVNLLIVKNVHNILHYTFIEILKK